MAAAYYGPSAGRTALNGGSRLEQQTFFPSLPNGACGFRDLAAGVQAPTCGCRRFWLNSAIGVENATERACWCYCGHHACFHDNNHTDAVPVAHASSRILPRESTPNAFFSSGQADGQGEHVAWVPPTWSELMGEHDRQSQRTTSHTTPAAPGSATGLGIRNSQPQAQPRSINARLWQALNTFARDQDGDKNSDLPSTAVPSLYEEPQNRNMGPPVSIPANTTNIRMEDCGSATEVATPSVRGTPDFRTRSPGPNIPTPAHAQVGASRPNPLAPAVSRHDHASRASQPTPPPTVSVGPSLSIQEMCNTIQNYGQRLNYLEGVSFSHMSSAEALERFDLIDGRLIDLESWRKDEDRAQAANETHERLQRLDDRLQDVEDWRTDQEHVVASQQSGDPAENSSSRLRRLLPIDTASFASEGSFDENAAAQTEAVVLATLAANAETHPRIDALVSRITSLETATLPSIARPWHVQVVLLPFGRQLPGIWFTAAQSTRNSISSATQLTDEWTVPPASVKSSFRSADAWTTESIEAWAHGAQDEWLSPKACGPSGAVFQRLASRGMVQHIVLQSPDAHHLCSAVASAFDGVLPRTEESATPLGERYLGLQERFIPLRKVRKSSRLRFLSRAEMLTPATWTAGFLDSSVFMKVDEGERRLYITTPAGYLQPSVPCWSWPAIRELAMYDVAGEVQQAQAAGNVVESCWTRHSNLDAPSLPSSFTSSKESPWGDSSDDGISEREADAPMLSPTATRTSLARSASLPRSIPGTEAELLSKRRVASFEVEGSDPVFDQGAEFLAKRRRISISPEVERRGFVNLTPRWSREPPSPYNADDIGLARSSQAPSNRATTPFAYATPHSHFDSRAEDDDGDTDVDDAEGGEEWEGVQEMENHSIPDPSEDGDDVNLDDGLTIYEV